MSIDKKIRDAVISFGDPVENGVYQGEAKSYYTFNYESLGTDFGDDEPGHERYIIQLHYFAPFGVNITQRIRQTKQAIFAAGFTWPEVVNADEENTRHRVFEFEGAEGAEVHGQV